MDYAFKVFWVDCWGKPHYSSLIYNESEANEFADNRMYAGALYYDPPRVIVLEI